MEAIVARPNITGYIAYHTFSGVHLRPYGGYDDDHFPTPDLRAYKLIGAEATKLHGLSGDLDLPRLQVRPEEVDHGLDDRLVLRPHRRLLVDHRVLEPAAPGGHRGLRLHRMDEGAPARGRPQAAALERRAARREGLRRLVRVRPSAARQGRARRLGRHVLLGERPAAVPRGARSRRTRTGRSGTC